MARKDHFRGALQLTNCVINQNQSFQGKVVKCLLNMSRKTCKMSSLRVDVAATLREDLVATLRVDVVAS